MRFWRGTAALVAAIAMMLLYVWRTEHAQILAAEAQILREEHQRLEDRLDRVRARRTALSSVSRIKALAAERLGLVEPEQLPVIVPAIEPLSDTDSLEQGIGDTETGHGSRDQ